MTEYEEALEQARALNEAEARKRERALRERPRVRQSEDVQNWERSW